MSLWFSRVCPTRPLLLSLDKWFPSRSQRFTPVCCYIPQPAFNTVVVSLFLLLGFRPLLLPHPNSSSSPPWLPATFLPCTPAAALHTSTLLLNSDLTCFSFRFPLTSRDFFLHLPEPKIQRLSVFSTSQSCLAPVSLGSRHLCVS